MISVDVPFLTLRLLFLKYSLRYPFTYATPGDIVKDSLVASPASESVEKFVPSLSNLYEAPLAPNLTVPLRTSPLLCTGGVV